MIIPLIHLLIAVFIIGILVYAILEVLKLLPLPAVFRTIVILLACLILVLVLLDFIGIDMGRPLLR